MQSLVSPTLSLLPLTLSLDIQIFLAVIAAATAAPQIVPYVHEEIAAEPYIHQEIAAEPYIHQEILAEPYVHSEPALTAAALGATGPTGYAAGPLLVVGSSWTGACRNNLGLTVPCRQ